MTQAALDHIEDVGKRSVLGRAFDILDCFQGDDPEQTIASLCARTGLPPATVHRLLASLVEWGAIERTSRGRYRLGMRLWRLGWGVPNARNLRDVARPFLVDLHAATGEVVTLASRDGADLIVADVIAGQSASRRWRMPRRLPLAATAAGLVLLAHGPVDDAEESCLPAAAGAARRAEFAARQRLSEIRRTGVAVTRPEAPDGLAWVSAPVFAPDGGVRSAVSVTVPVDRLNTRALARVVLEAANGVTAGLRRRDRLRSVVGTASA